MYKYRNLKQVLLIFGKLTREEHIKKSLLILKLHHLETHEHSLRVAKLSIDIALENKFTIRIVKTIGRAALLHDFGKSHIDTKILSKDGPLDAVELSEMTKHPRLGIIELKKFLSPEARKIIISHHEFKAKPYPRKPAERRQSERAVRTERRKKNLIDSFTQIVAAADMYDALSFPRAYKMSFPLDKVRDIMAVQFIGKSVLIKQLSDRPLKFNGRKLKTL